VVVKERTNSLLCNVDQSPIDAHFPNMGTTAGSNLYFDSTRYSHTPSPAHTPAHTIEGIIYSSTESESIPAQLL
jgi:hypothetical protein